MQFIEAHTNEITTLCQTHHVKQLYAFGSVLTNAFTLKSDVDLVVDFNTMATEQYADNYFDLKFGLQKLLQRNVDLLEESAIENPYFKEAIKNQRQLIYGC